MDIGVVLLDTDIDDGDDHGRIADGDVPGLCRVDVKSRQPAEPARPREAWRRKAAAACAAALLLIASVVYLTESKGFTSIARWLGLDPAASASHPPGSAGARVVPRPPPRPFAVVPAGGGSVQTFATVAEAVAAASPGEVVEVRQDGRVETGRIDLGRKPLWLRAGAGCSPVLLRSDGEPRHEQDRREAGHQGGQAGAGPGRPARVSYQQHRRYGHYGAQRQAEIDPAEVVKPRDHHLGEPLTVDG